MKFPSGAYCAKRYLETLRARACACVIVFRIAFDRFERVSVEQGLDLIGASQPRRSIRVTGGSLHFTLQSIRVYPDNGLYTVIIHTLIPQSFGIFKTGTWVYCS